MITVIAVPVCIIVSIVVFLLIPYSKTHSEFISKRDKIFHDTTQYCGMFSDEILRFFRRLLRDIFITAVL